MLTTKPKRGERFLLVSIYKSKDIPELVTVISSGSVHVTVMNHGRKEKFDTDGRGNSYFELWEPENYHTYTERDKLIGKARKLTYSLDFDAFSLDKLNRIIEAIES